MAGPGHFDRYTPHLAAAWPEGVGHQAVDGSMVFCDISGFTALSERLAKKGRVGSEEVAAALTQVFSELLDIALGRGGDLLKFGGDALLLLFTGDEHCARASAAAVEMMERLGTVGRIDTGSGRVVLGMTAGVNTGTFDIFRVGDLHNVLIIAGADASGTVRSEESATNGQIIVTEAVAAALGDAVTQLDDGRFLLASAPEAPDAPDTARPSNPDLAMYVPTALRDVVGTPASDGEHRRAVIAFLKFKGLDAGIAERGAEATWSDLDATARIVQAAADEFGVTFLSSDIDVDGGKIILIAGAPTTSDNDAERLLRAVRAIEDAAPPLKLKIGVNSGTLFAGDVGSPTRAAYTVIGDPVNLAARLMGQAEPGQILAESTVLARSDTTFATTPVEPFYVKGKSEPVDAVVLGAVTGTGGRTTAELPMVGRVEMLEQLLDEFAHATVAGTRMIDLVGPAGIGKTRLLAAARFLPDDASWIKIDCERYEQSTSYYALRLLIRWLLGVSDEPDPEAVAGALRNAAESRVPTVVPWLPLVAYVIGIDMEPTAEVEALADDFRRARTHDVILELVNGLIAEPVALVFDNAQWLDDSSKELLLGAERFADSLPWLICLSDQTIDRDGRDGARRIELGPLSDAECLELAYIVASDQPIPQHRLLEAVERSGGNPIFLISLVKAAIEGSDLPENVEDLVNARIDGLDQEARKVLRCAAVVGARFRAELLAIAIGDDVADVEDPDLWRRLDEFVERQPNGDLVFRQNLYRDVAYAGLPYRMRRRLHLRVGNAIETRLTEFSDQLLARHFMLAEEYERGFTYSVQAADKAAAKYDHVTAADLYQQAIDAGRRLRVPKRELARIHEARGVACEAAGLYDEAESAFLAARKRSEDDPIAVARLLGRLGLLRERSGNYVVALRWLTRGRKLLDGVGAGAEAGAERARLELAHAGVRYRQGKYDACRERCLAALDIPGIDLTETAHARYLLCLAYAHLNDPRSEEEGERALETFDELGDQLGRANVLNNLGMNAYYRGNWDDALSLWQRSGEAREACGDIVGAATQTNNLGEIYSDQGKWDRARECFTEALRIWQGARYGVGVALASSNLGRVEARSGNHDVAADRLVDAVDGFESIGAAGFALEARIRQVENQLLAGDDGAVDAALELLPQAEKIDGTTIPEAILHRLLGRAHLAANDTAAAERSLQRSLELARSADAPFEEAQTLDALAQLRGDDADPTAAEIFERLGVVRVP